MNLKIRRIQYAPESRPRTGLQTLITKSFIGCYGSIELEATLDKRVRSLVLGNHKPLQRPLKMSLIDLGQLPIL